MAQGWTRRTPPTRRAPRGRVRACYRDPSGKTVSRVFDTKDAAEKYLAKATVNMTEGSYTDPNAGKVKWDAFFARFMEESPNLRPTTRDSYERLARAYLAPHFGEMGLSSITRGHVAAWLGKLKESGTGDATTNAAYRLLRTVLNRAVSFDLIARNPAARMGESVPKSEREEMRFLSAEEIERIADAAGPRYRALLLLLGFGGLRIGEAAALRTENVNILKRRVQVDSNLVEVGGKVQFGQPKTKLSRRAVAIPPFVAQAIGDHMAEFPPRADGLIFTGKNGAPIHRTTFRRRVFVPACEAAKIAAPLPRVHDLRHSAASLMVQAGGHPKEVSAQLGHSGIGITMDRYSHLFDGMADDLAERMEALRSRSTVEPGAASVRPETRSEVITLPTASA